MHSSPQRRVRRRPLRLAILGAVLLVATACGNTLPSGAAALVNGQVISTELLTRIVDAQAESAGIDRSAPESAQQVAELQRQILAALISFEITEDVASERGIELTAADLDEEFETQIALAGDEETLLSQVESLGLTVDEWKDILLSNIIRQRLIAEDISSDVIVDDATVQETFDQREAAGQYDTADVSHILIAFDGDVDDAGAPTADAEAAALAGADDVLTRLDEGEEFEDLAVELSDDPGSGANGGQLGEAPLSQYVPEFAAAAAEADIDEVVGPVRTQFGYHLIRVNDRTTVSFEDVADSIRDELSSQESGPEIEAAFSAGLAAAEVTVPERLGRWNGETGAIEDAASPVQNIESDPANEGGVIQSEG